MSQNTQNSEPSHDETIERDDADATSLDELNPQGAGATVTGAPSSFEPEEPEHPADDK